MTGACIAVAVALGGVPVTQVTTVHAAACVAGSGIGLDPRLSQSDFTATPSSAYRWAGITQVCGSSAIAPDGGSEAVFQVSLAAPLPSFPDASGDIGVGLVACSDVTSLLASTPLQIGVNHRGQPVFDGPYPPEDGWKVCTFVDVSAALPLDYGVAFYDPAGGYTTVDFPSLVTAGGTSTITPPSGVTPGSTVVTLYLPDTVSYHVDPPAPPLQGVARTFNEPVLGATVSNALAFTKMSSTVTLPFPICVGYNPPSISCDNHQFLGPVYGVTIDPGPMGWAPGEVTCSTIGGLPNPATCSAAGTGGLRNAVDLGAVPMAPRAEAVTTPCADPLDPSIVDCAVETPPATTYNPCQSTNTPGGQDVGDLYAATTALSGIPCVAGPISLPNAYVSLYGRIWSGEPSSPLVDGFTIGPAFLPDGFIF